MNLLGNDVKEYEPKIALSDFSDGLSFYKKIAKEGRNLLNIGGYMIVETGGEQQYYIVKKIFLDMDYNVTIHKDQNKDQRFLEIHL